jgi:hypothetical protein
MTEMEVEVVFARPETQSLVSVSVPPGSSVAMVIDASGVEALYPDERFDQLEVGVWGRIVDRARVVVAGDRVELYRPLQIEPREARRQLALAGRTMGSVDKD